MSSVLETFSLAATVSGGVPPYTYEWDFGDGSPTVNVNPTTHSYSQAGTFTVTVIVTDSLGMKLSGIAQVVVSPPSQQITVTIVGYGTPTQVATTIQVPVIIGGKVTGYRPVTRYVTQYLNPVPVAGLQVNIQATNPESLPTPPAYISEAPILLPISANAETDSSGNAVFVVTQDSLGILMGYYFNDAGVESCCKPSSYGPYVYTVKVTLPNGTIVTAGTIDPTTGTSFILDLGANLPGVA